MLQTGSVFRGWLYVAVYLSFMLPSTLFAILFTASAYQISRRLDLTLVLFAAFALLSMTAWSESWLLRWINPPVYSMSDDFGNTRLLQSVLYNRLFWLLLLCGLCAVSFLCVRRYGKGLFGSAARNVRKVYLPLLVVVCLLSGYAVYTYQPFLDHSKAEIDMDAYYNIAYNEYVFFDAIHVEARPNLSTGRFYGTALYSLHNTSGKPQTISLYVNPGYRVSSVTANQTSVAFRDCNDDDQNTKTVEVDLPAEEHKFENMKSWRLPTVGSRRSGTFRNSARGAWRSAATTSTWQTRILLLYQRISSGRPRSRRPTQRRSTCQRA